MSFSNSRKLQEVSSESVLDSESVSSGDSRKLQVSSESTDEESPYDSPGDSSEEAP